MIKPTITLSFCACKFPILHEDIPLGTLYDVDIKRRIVMDYRCGGCQKWFHVDAVFCKRRGTSNEGYLPSALFFKPPPQNQPYAGN